jgi:hypothetical protein
MARLEQTAPKLARLIRPLHERLMGEPQSNAARTVIEPPERE